MTVPRYIQATPDGVALSVYVQPRAKSSQLAGEYNGKLKLKIASPPVDGKANQEVCRFLAKLLGVPKSAASIKQGASNRAKVVLVRQVAADDAARVLTAGVK